MQLLLPDCCVTVRLAAGLQQQMHALAVAVWRLELALLDLLPVQVHPPQHSIWEGNICLNILREDWKPVLSDLFVVIWPAVPVSW